MEYRPGLDDGGGAELTEFLRMFIKPTAVAAVALVGLTLAGCGSLRQATGQRTVPDEFRVVTLAPLVVPPEYSLRPPAPGEPRPAELQPESAARAAILGRRAATERTPGEQAFAARAGADAADPLIRFVVDDEFGDIAHKERSFVDRILFWRGDGAAPTTLPSAAETGGTTPANIDPAAEAARLQALTGGQPVVIRRETRRTTKLPGL